MVSREHQLFSKMYVFCVDTEPERISLSALRYVWPCVLIPIYTVCAEGNCAPSWRGPLRPPLCRALCFSSYWPTELETKSGRSWCCHQHRPSSFLETHPGLLCEPEINIYCVESLCIWMYSHSFATLRIHSDIRGWCEENESWLGPWKWGWRRGMGRK